MKRVLNALAERVEAGEIEYDFSSGAGSVITYRQFDEIAYALGNGELGGKVCEAIGGSLDAAKALHDAVLPGWYVNISINPEDESAEVELSSPINQTDLDVGGLGITPAAAWVSAILRAKAQEQEDD